MHDGLRFLAPPSYLTLTPLLTGDAERMDTVEVTIPVEVRAAAALTDPFLRARIGRVISRVLLSSDADRPADAVTRLEVQAEACEPTGTTDPERRATEAAERFRAFRRGRRLDGLDPAALIRAGRR